MTSRANAGFWHAIRGILRPARASVHFHIDADGRALICDSGRFDSPVLTLKEASLTETGARRRIA
jgi:hypothetical protein